MIRMVILGAGTAGTMMANHLRKRFPVDSAQITLVDRDDIHVYQPGLLFLPFGRYTREDIVRSRREFLPENVEFVTAEAETIDGARNRVRLRGGEDLPYDLLIIATGSRIVPTETPGLGEDGWQQTIFDFYTLEGAVALREALKNWKGGRLVVHIKEMPIKCPVAPLEFAFLADAHFKERGMRDRVQIAYVTPLSGPFTQPVCSETLTHLLDSRKIEVVTDFDVEHVDPGARKLVGFDGREVPYDLLVTVPTNMGDPLVERSGLGDELGFVPTHPKTLQAKAFPNIFVIGDATNIATSKAGSVAHFEAEVLAENIARYLRGEPLREAYDGHANCFVETGAGKGLLIDFNSTVEPLPGKFPWPVVGPLSLLRESRWNHWGKLAFRWVYWNWLLRAHPIPFVPAILSMSGKEIPRAKAG